MRTRWTFGALFVAALLALPAVFADEEKKSEEEKVDLAKIKCPISGQKINPEATVEYKEATVYFCCENCPKAFTKDPKNEKFAAKVNYQLVATKQAKQKACPMSGQKLNEETAIEVGYAKVPVAFCCENCQKKAKSIEEEDKVIALIFGDEEKFTKAFKIGDDEDEEGEDEDEPGDEDENDEEDDDADETTAK